MERFERQGGITPACAGKRPIKQLSDIEWQDHPRVCGEKVRDFAALVKKDGSPPRVRGKVGGDLLV